MPATTFAGDLWSTPTQTRAAAFVLADRPTWGYLGTLSVSVKGAAKLYDVAAVHTPGSPGRTYRLRERGKPGRVLTATLAADGVACDCEAGVYRHAEPGADGCACKHGSALVVLVEAGVLPHPADSPLGLRADPEEMLLAAA